MPKKIRIEIEIDLENNQIAFFKPTMTGGGLNDLAGMQEIAFKWYQNKLRDEYNHGRDSVVQNVLSGIEKFLKQ